MGSVGAKKSGGEIEIPVGERERKKEPSGEVSFGEIVNASKNHIVFDKTITVLPDKYQPESGKKGDLESLINKYSIKDAWIEMYEDKSGANDLKHVQDLGFEVEAWHRTAQQEGSSIPDRIHFYVKKKKKPTKKPIVWKGKTGSMTWTVGGKTFNSTKTWKELAIENAMNQYK